MRPCLPVLALAILATAAPAAPPRFVTYPSVRGDQVVFTWDGDLWRTSLSGGQALRLTSHPGNESFARISPDGKWIAFTGTYEGTPSVYVMPVEGGSPRRLTWRGSCTVRDWTPDGKKILFKMAKENAGRAVERLYTVDLEGHEPEVLPLQKAITGAFAPDGRLAFSSKGREEYYWKRYKGGTAQDLWLADFKQGRFEPLTDYPGRNASPMWIGGKVCFTSDRTASGITNLFELDPATKAVKQLTDYKDFDVQMAATDGKTVVFAQAGYLMAMDATAKQPRRVAVELASDDWKRRPRAVNAASWLHAAMPSQNGKHIAVEARGDLFLVDPTGKTRAKNLTQTSGVRERLPVLNPDGTQLAYVSDEGGAYDLYVRPTKGGPAIRIPTGVKGLFSQMLWSPDGKKLLFGDQTFALYLVDVAARKVTKLASSNVMQNDQFTWEQADYAWAPDSTWIAYSFQEENRQGRIWLHNTATGQRIPVTNGFYASINPRFDPEGQKLYFLSYANYHSVLDPTQDNHIQDTPVEVHAVALKASGDGPFRVDAEGLSDRISVLPIKPGNLFHLEVGKGVLGYSSVDAWDEPTNEQVFKANGTDRWKLHIYDLAKGKDITVPDLMGGWHFTPDGTQIQVLKNGGLHLGPVAQVMGAATLPPRIELSDLVVPVVPQEEWNQVFTETWRLYNDFFYDKNMHGNDWKAIGEKFRAWLPDCPNRNDLNWLLSQMVGELCVGHTYVGGGDTSPNLPGGAPLLSPGLLGADYGATNGVYTFQKIYGPTPYARNLKAPLHKDGFLVKEGECLLAINGEPLRAPEAIHKRLQIARGQKVTLTVNTKPTLEGARQIEVEPVLSEDNLRYQNWVAQNIAEVERMSEGQLGYAHITAMGEQNTGEFDKYWRAFRNRKGLVIDVRGNGGGWTEYFIIDKLERKHVGWNVLRDMAPFRYPGTAGDGRYVFLSNEQNGSDGEAFLAHVKARNLGTIVGVRSWGGLVGILNPQVTIDGGSINQPNNAFYGHEGKWWVENEGAVPDILVENGPDPKDGDRQLKVAVETLLKQLKAQPTTAFPARPPYPKR